MLTNSLSKRTFQNKASVQV